jgi:phospholipid-binding lipoprotein MlaA
LADLTETPLRPRHLLALAGLGAAFVAGQVRAQTPGDPFEKVNRRLYAGAISADRKYVRPISHIYRGLTPGLLGQMLHNFFTNLGEPHVVVDDLLQLRIRRAGDDLARLVTNTTFGIGGLADVAVTQGLPHRDNDFGVTLGRWGVGPGPYLFLPFLGPSTLRDAIGQGADIAFNPLTYIRFPGRITTEITTTIIGSLDKRVQAEGDLEAATADAADPYATIRSDYLQSREAMIRGEDAAPVLPPIDDPPPAAPAASPAPGPAAAIAAPARVAAADDRTLAAADPDAAMVTAQPCDTAGMRRATVEAAGAAVAQAEGA